MTTSFAALLGYLSGSVPVGYWLIHLTKGVDIRTIGTGSTGAGNIWRTFGRRYGLPVMLLNMTKAFGPALGATVVVGHVGGVVAGMAAMLGNRRLILLRSARGGASATLGALLGIAPAVCGIGLAIWMTLFALTRYATVASIGTALALPALAVALGGYGWSVIAFNSTIAALIVLGHRRGMSRLLNGSEKRLEF